jgi:hypothetical protein
MREGLAREFPDAGRASAWARAFVGGRRPVLSSEPVIWATISGIGAGLLTGFIAQALVSLTSQVVQALRAPMPFELFHAVTISGTAAAAAVALSAGGPLAFALVAAYVALGVALRIPGVMFACERSGGVLPFPGPDLCTALGYVASLWPQLIGLGLGIALSRSLTTRGDGINSLLRIAGALAIALFGVSQMYAASVAQGGYVAEPAGALTSGLTVGAGMVTAAVAAGVIAAHVPHGMRSASILVLIWLLPWFAGQLPYALRSLPGPIAAENFAPIVLSLVIQPIGAVFLILSAAITSRARFIPRDTA